MTTPATIARRVQDIEPGDTIKTWMGFRRVHSIEPYDGPFGFVIGVARFDDGTGMTMGDTDQWCCVVPLTESDGVPGDTDSGGGVVTLLSEA